MKVDKKTMENLVSNLERDKSEVVEDYDNFIADIKKAKSVEAIMFLKRQFLRKLIRNLPLYSTECYFCIYHGVTCSNCEYGKKHGECGITTQTNSYKDKLPTWDKIRNARNRLDKIIDEEYYKMGENYGD